MIELLNLDLLYGTGYSGQEKKRFINSEQQVLKLGANQG
jgi:hypothetical protein